MNHFTNVAGYNGIRATHPAWTFRAARPPGNHPPGAYFTPLAADTPNLANRLRIPVAKLSHFFSFQDADDLRPLRGGRGNCVVYSPRDYVVPQDRQQEHGGTGL